VIHSSPLANRGSHLACTSGAANSCSSRMPPVCSWYIWPMLESPAEMAITTRMSSAKLPPVAAVLARDHEAEEAGGAERRALLVRERAVPVTLGGAGPELVAQPFRDPDRVLQVDARERGAPAGRAPIRGWKYQRSQLWSR